VDCRRQKKRSFLKHIFGGPVEAGTVKDSHLQPVPRPCCPATGASSANFFLRAIFGKDLRYMECIREARSSLCKPELLHTSHKSDHNGCSEKPHAAGCLNQELQLAKLRSLPSFWLVSSVRWWPRVHTSRDFPECVKSTFPPNY
jgi:hypothetical protein